MKNKPIIICGDFNVAYSEKDLANPNTNHHNAGFTDEERNKFGELLNAGFVDAFRSKYPDKENCYTWWSYMRNAREKNIGWRLDYFLINEEATDKINDCKILSDVLGSDHCPIELDLNI